MMSGFAFFYNDYVLSKCGIYSGVHFSHKCFAVMFQVQSWLVNLDAFFCHKHKRFIKPVVYTKKSHRKAEIAFPLMESGNDWGVFLVTDGCRCHSG